MSKPDSSVNNSSLIATSSGPYHKGSKHRGASARIAHVEGVVIRPTGKPYPASPIMSVPIAESPSVGDDAPLWARTQCADSGPGMSSKVTEALFALTAYHQFAHQLRDKAQDICQRA
jgi:hypothetical protein